MSLAGSIRAGGAYIELTLKQNSFVAGLQRAEGTLKAASGRLNAIASGLFGLGAGGVTGLFGLAKVFSDVGDGIAKAAQRAGVSASSFSELAHAAGLSGADAASLEQGLTKLNKTIGDAKSGSRPAIDALKQLGLTISDLQGLSPDKQFEVVADRIAQIQDPALKTSYAMDIMGKSATKLIPMMNSGADGIAEMRKQAVDLGIALTDEDAKAAEILNDALGTLYSTMKGVVLQVGAAMAPLISEMSDAITKVVSTVIKWIKENRELVVTVFKVAAGIAVAGVALFGLSALVYGVSFAFGGVVIIMGVLGSAFSMLGTVVAAILSPFGLVAVALAAVIYYSGAGSEALAWLQSAWGDLSAFVGETVSVMSQALMNGDIASAAKVLWASLRVVWATGVAYLKQIWAGVKTGMIAIFQEAVFKISDMFLNTWYGLEDAWVETVDFFKDTWSIFTGFLQKTWNSTIGFISKAWARLKGLFTDIDVKAEIERINKETTEKNDEVDNKRNETISKREGERLKKKQSIENNRKGALEENDIDRKNAEKNRQDALDADVSAAQDELEKIKKEREALINQIKQDSQPGIFKSAFKDVGKPATGAATAVNQKVENRAIDSQTLGSEVASTFRGVAAAGLGAGKIFDQIAESTKITAKNTDPKNQKQAKFGA